MSLKQNAEWLEAANENFQTALEENNVELAKAIIADTFDAGFDAEARQMNVQLREKTQEVSEEKGI